MRAFIERYASPLVLAGLATFAAVLLLAVTGQWIAAAGIVALVVALYVAATR